MPDTVRTRPEAALVLVTRDDLPIAASMAAIRLSEDGHEDVFYLPEEAALFADHRPAPTRTHCPRKGDAAYFDVADVEDGAWVYYDPLPQAEAIAGHLAYDRVAFDIERRNLPPLDPEAAGVLSFWFEETPPEKHFADDPDFDATIARRFDGLVERAASGELDGWAEHPRGALALVILLDQFTRNIHGDAAAAYAQDPAARAAAEEMVRSGHDLALPPQERAFAYMPFMHSEDLEDQNWCVELFTDRLPGAMNVPYAIGHRRTVHRHGRFPHRDGALGRDGS
jgi:uncharacterized protein (DUF924 family)/uncharacterized protein (DUF427 family)